MDDAAKWTDELLSSAGKFSDILQKLYKAFDDVGLINLGVGPDTVVDAGASGVDQGVQSATG